MLTCDRDDRVIGVISYKDIAWGLMKEYAEVMMA